MNKGKIRKVLMEVLSTFGVQVASTLYEVEDLLAELNAEPSQVHHQRIDDLGRVVIPKVEREELGIMAGDELAIQRDGKQIIIQRVEAVLD